MFHHRIGKILAAATVSVLAAGLMMMATPEANADSGDCVPVAIMGMRGSSENTIGETKYSPTTVSNGYEGAIVTRLLWGLTWYYGSNPELKNVPVVGLSTEDGYRASSLDDGGFPAATRAGSKLWSSAVDGAAAAINKMDSFQAGQPANCAPTKWILVGYSQGAMVARWAYAEAPERVASLYLMGDPFYSAGQPGNLGGNGDGVVTSMVTGDYSAITKYYQNRPADSIDLCAAGDIICDHTSAGSNWLVHLLYLINPFDAAGAAAPLRDMITRAGAAVAASTQLRVAATTASLSANISVEGMPTLISAAQSRVSGPATYEFDFDNDGRFEASSTRPALARIFAAGPNTINVRVTDSQGTTSTATHQFRTMTNAVAFGGAPAGDATPFAPSALSGDADSSGTPAVTTPTMPTTPTTPTTPTVTVTPTPAPTLVSNNTVGRTASSAVPPAAQAAPAPTKVKAGKVQARKAAKVKKVKKGKKAKKAKGSRR